MTGRCTLALAAWSPLALTVMLTGALAVVGCRGRAGQDGRTVLTVYAASSLTEVFEAIETRYEGEHPEVDVQLVFAGSQVLRLQLEQGARADVFASANPEHLQALVDAGLAAPGQLFARGELVLIVPADDPDAPRSFADLDQAQRIVTGAANVPVGAYTDRALAQARTVAELGDRFVDAVEAKIVSRESNVRLVRAKVELGEADAAFVYRSDVVGAPNLRVIALPEAVAVSASYPVAALEHAIDPAAARAFVDYLTSPQVDAVLEVHGFEPAR